MTYSITNRSWMDWREASYEQRHRLKPINNVDDLLDANSSEAAWMIWQRISHERGDLSTARVKSLEKIPGWVWMTDFERDCLNRDDPDLCSTQQITWCEDGIPMIDGIRQM